MTNFDQLLAQQGYVLLDGGLATQLESMGYDLNSKLWSAELLMSNPEAIEQAHLAYLRAGSNCIITSSYQANIQSFIDLGKSYQEAIALMKLTSDIALSARAKYLDENPTSGIKPLIAGSIGPYGAYLADGSEYKGHYDINQKELVNFHAERFEIISNSGIDLLACETIPSLDEAMALSQLMEQHVTPGWISFSCKDGLHINEGASIRSCAKSLNDVDAVIGIGINCTNPIYLESLIDEIRIGAPDKHIVVYPNLGETYNAQHKKWEGNVSAIDFAKSSEQWLNHGARLIGGCCRVGPENITTIKNMLDAD